MQYMHTYRRMTHEITHDSSLTFVSKLLNVLLNHDLTVVTDWSFEENSRTMQTANSCFIAFISCDNIHIVDTVNTVTGCTAAQYNVSKFTYVIVPDGKRTVYYVYYISS